VERWNGGTKNERSLVYSPKAFGFHPSDPFNPFNRFTKLLWLARAAVRERLSAMRGFRAM
jgi:hypothetical protein